MKIIEYLIDKALCLGWVKITLPVININSLLIILIHFEYTVSIWELRYLKTFKFDKLSG